MCAYAINSKITGRNGDSVDANDGGSADGGSSKDHWQLIHRTKIFPYQKLLIRNSFLMIKLCTTGFTRGYDFPAVTMTKNDTYLQVWMAAFKDFMYRLHSNSDRFYCCYFLHKTSTAYHR